MVYFIRHPPPHIKQGHQLSVLCNSILTLPTRRQLQIPQAGAAKQRSPAPDHFLTQQPWFPTACGAAGEHLKPTVQALPGRPKSPSEDSRRWNRLPMKVIALLHSLSSSYRVHGSIIQETLIRRLLCTLTGVKCVVVYVREGSRCVDPCKVSAQREVLEKGESVRWII